MKYKVYFLSLIFFISFLQSQTLDNDKLFETAIQQMHNMQYEKSLKSFSEVIENDSLNFFALLGKLQVERFLLIEKYGNEFDKSKLIDKIENLTGYYKIQLEKDPENINLNFCMALSIGFKLRVLVSEKNSFYIVYNGLQSLKYIKKCDKLSSNNPDVEFMKGVFEYYISKYPGVIKYFSKVLINNSGDSEIAKSKIDYAAKSNSFMKYDANYTLAFLYLYIENQPQKALPYLELLTEKFPKNLSFYFMQTFGYLQLGKMDLVDQAFNNYTEGLKRDTLYFRSEFENRAVFLEAMIAVKNQDFENALKLFAEFVGDYNMELEHLMAIANFETGKIYDLTEQRKKAIKAYKSTLKIDNGTYPIKLAKEYLKNSYK